MAERKPVVLIGGQLKELPSGDTLPGSGSGSGGIPEAPTDGGTYARRNGAWVRAIAEDSDPTQELINYLLGTPSGATLDTMLGSIYWRMGLSDLIASTSAATVFADSEAMLAICTSARAYRTITTSSSADSFRASTGLTVSDTPTMTSNTAPSGVAAASTTYSTSYDAFKAFDGTSAYWCSASGNTTNQWVRYDFGTPVLIHTVQLTTGTDQPTKDFRIEYSDDATTWTSAFAGTLSPSAVVTYYLTELVGKHRYWRFFAVNSSGGSYVSLQEMKLKGFSW